MSSHEHEKVDPDTTSDPNLSTQQEEREDEGTPSDWSSEGGATVEGPATHSGPADEHD